MGRWAGVGGVVGGATQRVKDRRCEIILLRRSTYDRHGLYLRQDCFFREMRKVSFQYDKDIHSASCA